MAASFPKIAQFKTPAALRARIAALQLDLPLDDTALSASEGSPLAAPLRIGGATVGNRWCIHPMEGWDANRDGSPSEFTIRRWTNFGLSGAKLIWGGEAVAVAPDSRANPRQLLAMEANLPALAELHSTLVSTHRDRFGGADDLLVGLQLTHSGRFSRPNDRPAPRIAYHHPLLDARLDLREGDRTSLLTDDDLEQIIDQYVAAAKLAARAGFRFVDVKACHGYLLHETLSARRRPGPFGGDFNGRIRMLTAIVDRIRCEVPQLMVGVRLSVFDTVPFQTPTSAGALLGEPTRHDHVHPYDCGFGVDEHNPLKVDLREPIELLRRLAALGVVAASITAGSPYYNPHIQRPAIFPPSDGYQPPEDPLVGVARQMDAARVCKMSVPELPMVGAAYSYLQDYLPHAAQAAVRRGWIDCVGLGRMVLSYPAMPADVLAGNPLVRNRVCRTFSDCTTGPRNGEISGCYPLDPFYKALGEKDRRQ
jgi:2,4-dienoyl-CoA reductase-like NADH-dependent reductase (Old Yellow Enzyme family)